MSPISHLTKYSQGFLDGQQGTDRAKKGKERGSIRADHEGIRGLKQGGVAESALGIDEEYDVGKRLIEDGGNVLESGNTLMNGIYVDRNGELGEVSESLCIVPDAEQNGKDEDLRENGEADRNGDVVMAEDIQLDGAVGFGVSEDVKRAMETLKETNTGVVIPRFSGPDEDHRNTLFLLELIKRRSSFVRLSDVDKQTDVNDRASECKPVLYLVENFEYCVRRFEAFVRHSNMKLWREKPSDPELKGLDVSTMIENEAVVLTASSLLIGLGEGTLHLDQFSLIIFDRCEIARKSTHTYTIIIRDYYGTLPLEKRPRILAVGTEDLIFTRDVIEKNLSVEFINQEVDSASRHFFRQAPLLAKASPQLANKDIVFYQREHTPAVLKSGYLSLLTKEEKKRLQREQTENGTTEDKDYLLAELGPVAVHLYQRAFLRRKLIRRWKRMSKATTGTRKLGRTSFEGFCTEDKLLLGITRKALTLLNLLKSAFDGKHTPERPSIAIHAGRPVVAIALGELIMAFQGLSGLRVSIVLGETKKSCSFETTDDPSQEEMAFQGEETDDESVGAFNCGEVDVLIIATHDMKKLQEGRRPISPSSICIRFDGSRTDPESDGGGGHCRVLTFQPWAPPSSGSTRRHSGVDAQKPESLKRGPVSNENCSKDRARSRRDENGGANRERRRGTKRGHDDVSRELEYNADQQGPTKRIAREGRTITEVEGGYIPLNTEKDGVSKNHWDRLGEKESTVQVYEIKAVAPLRGPSPSHESYTYVYRLTSVNRTGSIESPLTGLENFAVCLSGPLPHVEEFIHLPDAPDKPPFLRLLLIQKIKLTPDQIERAREYHSFIFNLVIYGATECFEWGRRDYTLRQYLVVPVQKKHTKILEEGRTGPLELRSDDAETKPFAKYFKPRKIPTKNIPVESARDYEIDWEGIDEALSFRDSRTYLFQRTPVIDWDTATKLRRKQVDDLSKLEGKLVFTNYAKQVYMSSSLRTDQSPLMTLSTTITFTLDDKGYKKWHILPGGRKLPLPTRDRKEMELVKLKAKLERSGRLGSGDELDERLRKFSTDFDPERNIKRYVERKRTKYYEIRDDTYENYYVTRRRAPVFNISGPLLQVCKVSPFDLSNFLIVSGEGHFSQCVENKIQRTLKSRESPTFLLPEHASICPVNEAVTFLPVVLLHLERHATTCSLREKLQEQIAIDIPVREYARALTFTSADGKEKSSNYERLELLGDSVLKLASTIRLFADNPYANEGWMHAERTEIIKNETLTGLARDFALQHYLRVEKENLKEWTPPGRDRIIQKKAITDKGMADVMEALCGLFFVHGAASDTTKFVKPGYDIGMRFLEVTGILKGKEPTKDELLLSMIHSLKPKGSARPKSTEPQHWPEDERESTGRTRIAKLESLLGYRFIHKKLLLCALTHSSYDDGQGAYFENFQRLEFLGDAVLDLCVSKYLFERYPNLGPGMLTDLKGAAVQNENFGRIALERGFDKFIYSKAPPLEKKIREFRRVLKEEESAREKDQTFWSLEIGAPKTLGDVFESIAGAILIDGGMEQVWRIFSKLLKKTLDVRANPDTYKLNPMKKLQDFVTRTEKLSIRGPNFVVYEKDKAKMLRAVVSLHGVILGEGRGNSKPRAQGIAAKEALKKLMDSKEGVDDGDLYNSMKKMGFLERRSKTSN